MLECHEHFYYLIEVFIVCAKCLQRNTVAIRFDGAFEKNVGILDPLQKS